MKMILYIFMMAAMLSCGDSYIAGKKQNQEKVVSHPIDVLYFNRVERNGVMMYQSGSVSFWPMAVIINENGQTQYNITSSEYVEVENSYRFVSEKSVIVFDITNREISVDDSIKYFVNSTIKTNW
jgi:hypothetical protein